MTLAWLTLFNTVLAPVLGAILKILFQFKVIKSEEQVRETQRRIESAMKAADKVKSDPVDSQQQYAGVKDSVEQKWLKEFGGQK